MLEKQPQKLNKNLRENRQLQAEKARQIQIEKDIKEREVKRIPIEKA